MKKESKDALIKKMLIITDTREVQPFKYPNTVIRKLDAGDYSIEYGGKTYENEIIVERKGAVSELFAASGSERDRFERELEKLAQVPVRLVLCEWDFMEIVNDQPPGRLPASAVYGSICSWHSVYGVPFIFAGNRANARAYLWKLFYTFTEHKILGY